MEYWAVIWGTIIMGATGLAIWFKIDFTRFLPRWAVDVALTIHYYEAILACLAIIVWHFYHVIFDPDVYPMNTACVNGRVSKEWLEEEHAAEFEELEADDAKHVEAGPKPEQLEHVGTGNGLNDVQPRNTSPTTNDNGKRN
jgi:cytochrome b subunit of formate dehydrogenase